MKLGTEKESWLSMSNLSVSSSKNNSALGFASADFIQTTVKDDNRIKKLVSLILISSWFFLGASFLLGYFPSLIVFGALFACSSYWIYRCSLINKNFKNISLLMKKKSPLLNTFISGHSVLLTESGQESMKFKEELILSAKNSLEISGNYCGGKAFCSLLNKIKIHMKNNPNLKVRILLSSDLVEDPDKNLLTGLKASFPDRFEYLITKTKFSFFSRFGTIDNHAKMIIVDSKYCMIGGTGIHSIFGSRGDGSDEGDHRVGVLRFLEKYFRDRDVVIKGIISDVFRKEFYKLYALWSSRMEKPIPRNFFDISTDSNNQAHVTSFEEDIRKIDNVSIKAITCTPDKENPITDEYCRILEEAKPGSKIIIGNLLFSPCAKFMESLEKALENKVNVEIITHSVHSTSSVSSSFFCWSKRLFYHDLLSKYCKNLSIYEYQVPMTNYHAKILTYINPQCLSESLTIYGSYNLGENSHHSHDEDIVVMQSYDVAEKANRYLKKDILKSTKIELSQAKQWQGIEGLLARLQKPLVRAFA